jgi:hypothetical protein
MIRRCCGSSRSSSRRRNAAAVCGRRSSPSCGEVDEHLDEAIVVAGGIRGCVHRRSLAARHDLRSHRLITGSIDQNWFDRSRGPRDMIGIRWQKPPNARQLADLRMDSTSTGARLLASVPPDLREHRRDDRAVERLHCGEVEPPEAVSRAHQGRCRDLLSTPLWRDIDH